jgi:C4-type Zn-finger protein
MIIKEMLSQSRRDFTATMECEFCGNTVKNDSGYDDVNYHENVIPNMKCKKCDKSTVSKNGDINPQQTKYPDWLQL